MIFDQNVFLKGPCQFFKEEHEYMWIDAEKKHIVTTGSVSISPRRAVAISVHYVEIDREILKVQLAKSTMWIEHGCRKETEGVWWTIGGKDHFWEYLAAEKVPTWANDVIAKGVAQLEEKGPCQ